MIINVILFIIAVLVITFIVIKLLEKEREKKVEKMTYEEALKDYTAKKKNLVLTVATIKDGQVICNVYGHNEEILPQKEYEYEIGSITKTFTTSILAKAIDEGKIALDDTIDKYIDLENNQHYPTIKELATHTAGYGNYPLSMQIKSIKSIFCNSDNPFTGYTVENLEKDVEDKKLKDKDYDFEYSNFGMAVLGDVLSKVYKKDYYELVNEYAINDMALKDTVIEVNDINLIGNTGIKKQCKNWLWKEDDGYLPAGAMKSTINDMVKYAEIQMKEEKAYLNIAHTKQADVDVEEQTAIGLAWLLDLKNNIICHNGVTGSFNTMLAFDKEKQIAVIILSNYYTNDPNNPTSMGLKLIKELQ